jgi:carboxymethylenebutenolidase
MDQKIIDLFDEFTHSTMPRRTFMARLSALAGGTAAAAALIPLLEGSPAQAAMTEPNDPRLVVGTTGYRGATGPIKAYLARPKGDAKRPGVIVIHENRGLNRHVEDIARRLALAGFFTIAPDALSPKGGTPADSDRARDMVGALDRNKAVADFVAAVGFLDKNTATTGKVGCVGFCWGGGIANQVAVHAPDLDAAVVYYGAAPKASDVPRIRARLLLQYAGLDSRINAGIDGYRKALTAAGKAFDIYVYPGVNHGFNNDSRPARYDERAAELAWRRTIDFLRRTLG